MAAVTVSRLRRVAGKPPAYVLRRAGQELRQELQQLQLRACAAGRGPLSAARIVPGGSSRAAASTAGRELAPFAEAIALSRQDERLREGIARRGALAGERRVELFGEELVSVGIPPAWTTDPHTGERWPDGFHRRLDVLDLGCPTDVKLVWELSRLRHCVALAQTVVVLDDASALVQLAADLADWRARNPLGWTVNWTVGMEVALRAVNLICIDGVLLAGGCELPEREAHVASLYQHGWFLRRNLEISDLNGNHYLANAVGLLWLGAYFGEVGEAPEWFAQGLRMTRAAAREQVLDDGLDHEGSLPYHVLISEMFLMAMVVAGEHLAEIAGPVRRMLDAAVLFTDERGGVPDLGDDDGGRVAALSDVPSHDARRVLGLGAALMQHPGAAERCRDAACEDALWLAGPERLARAQSLSPPLPPASPIHFPSAGLIVMDTGRGDRVAMDVGPIGFRGRGGHGHLDALSFEAWIAGEPAVRDSGTGTYTGDPALRNALRAITAHTVVIVDDIPYASHGGVERLWGIDGDSPPRVTRLSTGEKEQTALVRQQVPCATGWALVERALTLSPGCLRWRDTVEAPDGATVRHLLQLPRVCELHRGEISHPTLIYRGQWPQGATVEMHTCPHSRGYGRCESAKRAVVSYRSDGEPAVVSWSIRSS
jgi:hypothetical protein